MTAASGSSPGTGRRALGRAAAAHGCATSSSRPSIRSSRPSTVSSGATSALIVSQVVSPRRASEISGTTSEAGAKPSQVGPAPPSSANANPPRATRPHPGGPAGASATACAESRGPLPIDLREPVRPSRPRSSARCRARRPRSDRGRAAQSRTKARWDAATRPSRPSGRHGRPGSTSCSPPPAGPSIVPRSALRSASAAAAGARLRPATETGAGRC